MNCLPHILIIIFNIHARVENFFKSRGGGFSGGSEEQRWESPEFILGNFVNLVNLVNLSFPGVSEPPYPYLKLLDPRMTLFQ